MELSALPGIGARKLDLYGEDVLATVTADRTATAGGPSRRRPRPEELAVNSIDPASAEVLVSRTHELHPAIPAALAGTDVRRGGGT